MYDCGAEGIVTRFSLPAIASDGRMLARFKQEIQLSRKVSHPNVCRVFDVGFHAREQRRGGREPELATHVIEAARGVSRDLGAPRWPAV